jgi:ABC-type uncharacterized transport system involved in gliding motility auxiliary subunit
MTDDAKRSAGGGVVRGSLLGAGVLLIFALLVLVNYLGWKYHARTDWTETKIYSLSETTENVLAGLDDLGKDVRVTVFITPGSRVYGPVQELLARYEAASPHLTVRWLDPERNPAEAQRLIEEYEVSNQSVVFEAGEERRVVSADDLAEIDFSKAQFGQEPEISAFKGEERFTSALVDLTQGEKPKVLFTTGHGERSLDDASGAGLRLARDLLGPDNVEIDEWASLGVQSVPEGTDLVVIAGPQAAFTEDELAALGGYLAGGGRLLVMLDPVLAPGGAGAGFVDLGLQSWLADYGIHVGDDMAVDPSTTPLGSSAETFYATSYGRHPITRALSEGGIPILVRYARSVSGGSGPEGTTVTELVRTGSGGWAVSSLDRESFDQPPEGDLRGPVALAVAVDAAGPEGSEEADEEGVEAEAGEGTPGEETPEARAAGDPDDADADEARSAGMRLVVVGDSDLATSTFLQVGPGNQTFVNNVFNWLIERETLLGIPAKRPEQVRLQMTPSQIRGSVALVVLGLPGLALALGIWVWFRRRRR